ncbi:nucleotidyltransferase family protein [Undibacterium fentianense]|uniref:Nucleotidyltransferase family protein n=1 Tax=Undibacterium fentianense TaxID=2828728 RepID=A0A941IG60_9BURK|nr:nucleotidyltransferase family protein [Undibacterium fentianense]MBR7799695.1 nucleotidyltransferase family protein [Undibacterium fentianense]
MQTFRCCGMLLAAGRGERFDSSGSKHKLLSSLADGRSILATSSANLNAVLPESMVVISAKSQHSQQLRETLSLTKLTICDCDDASLGLAHSLRAGLACLSVDCDAVVIALGDMPFVQPTTIHAMVASMRAGASVVVPTYAGQRGNPVGFRRHYFSLLSQLSGDQGARQLLRDLPVTELPVNDPGILRDIDYPADLSR